MIFQEDVRTQLSAVGLFPYPQETIEAIGIAIPMLWNHNVPPELPAIVVVVEDILFASDRYSKLQSETDDMRDN